MIEQPAFPARRQPGTGYVAQRILLERGPQLGPLGPWVLTTLTELGQIHVRVLSDADVAEWPPLYDDIADDDAIGLIPIPAEALNAVPPSLLIDDPRPAVLRPLLPMERAAIVATIHAPLGDGCACGQTLDRAHAEHVADMIDADETEQRPEPS